MMLAYAYLCALLWFSTGQWLFDCPLHYLQLWLDVSIHVFTLCARQGQQLRGVTLILLALQSAKLSLTQYLLSKKAEATQVSFFLKFL
jgi:hypothetical protein